MNQSLMPREEHVYQICFPFVSPFGLHIMFTDDKSSTPDSQGFLPYVSLFYHLFIHSGGQWTLNINQNNPTSSQFKLLCGLNGLYKLVKSMTLKIELNQSTGDRFHSEDQSAGHPSAFLPHGVDDPFYCWIPTSHHCPPSPRELGLLMTDFYPS